MSDRITEADETGTGEPRTANSGPGRSLVGEEASERATVPGGTSPSRETEQGTGFANRSGSGGSGGSGDPADEGSGGRSMDELLQGGGPAADKPSH